MEGALSPLHRLNIPPPVPPYKHFIAGVGTVEASSQDVAIGVPFSGIVSHIYVKVGEQIEEGAPLFVLDTRLLLSQLNEGEKKEKASAVNYESEKKQLELYQRLKDKRAVSESTLIQKSYAAELALRQLQEAQAGVDRVKTDLERSIIRAPFAGEVLRINIHIGETADANPFNTLPLIVFGKTKPLHIRVEVDEEEAWRVVEGEPAMAYVRGNASLAIPLKFLYIEPYIIPKSTLTGENSEQVDTRVLQIVYEMEKGTMPIYIGQVMDVYIKGLPSSEKF